MQNQHFPDFATKYHLFSRNKGAKSPTSVKKSLQNHKKHRKKYHFHEKYVYLHRRKKSNERENFNNKNKILPAVIGSIKKVKVCC